MGKYEHGEIYNTSLLVFSPICCLFSMKEFLIKGRMVYSPEGL